MKQRNLIPIQALVLLACLSLTLLATGPSLVHNGQLQDNLNAGGYAITNAAPSLGTNGAPLYDTNGAAAAAQTNAEAYASTNYAPIIGSTYYDAAGAAATAQTNAGTYATGAASAAQSNAEAASAPASAVTWILESTNFTAVAAHRYQVDTSGGAITVTLPATASVGDAIVLADAKLTWNTNSVTLARNGLNLNGGTTNYTASVPGNTLTAVYISSGYGWSVK